jgi:glutamate N-acetyltransferase/amino-acid N-acetyltransferase
VTETGAKTIQCPKGYWLLAKNVGIKDETLDLAVIFSETRATAAAVFTQSRFAGAPVLVGREHIADGYLQAIVVNSKNANVATGQHGMEIAREMTALVAAELGINAQDVLPSSTGVIGRVPPIEKIRAGLQGLKKNLQRDILPDVARAIMTTDAYPKYISRSVGNVVIAGVAKGAGMIEPNMATMLSYLITDAQIPSATLRSMLVTAVNKSFNMMSIDTDTSTSDTVVLMANGLAGTVDLTLFQQALDEVCIFLAREIARNGEGVTKLIEVTVSGAQSFMQAKKVAKSIVNSPLVKTAIYGCDPNWGRIAMAIGKCHEEKDIEPEKVTITMGETTVFRHGSPTDFALDAVSRYLANKEVVIWVELGLGDKKATVWGGDLTEGYVKENAYYTT